MRQFIVLIVLWKMFVVCSILDAAPLPADVLNAAEQMMRSHSEPEQQFQHEQKRLQDRYPALFKTRAIKPYTKTGPNPAHADLLFLAFSDICAYHLPCLYQEFPAFSTLYRPIFFEDLDGDGNSELFCAPLRLDGIFILIVQYIDGNVLTYYEQFVEIPHDGVTFSPQSRAEGNIDILGRREFIDTSECTRRNDRVVCPKLVFEMVFRFVDKTIHLIEPMHLIHQEWVPSQ